VPLPSDLVWRILFQSVIAVVLVAASVGIVLGVSLIVSSARTLRFFQVVNRWVSTRGAFKALDVPRSTEQFSHRHRRWVGWALIAGGLFATYGLLGAFDAGAVSAVFAKGGTARVLAIAAETLRWFLLVGGAAGVVVGAMLCFSPDALATLERTANRWISPRNALRGGDDMRLTLDKLVAAHPALSGWILACTSLGAVAYAARLLFARA
jgi:hypothetical protein